MQVKVDVVGTHVEEVGVVEGAKVDKHIHAYIYVYTYTHKHTYIHIHTDTTTWNVRVGTKIAKDFTTETGTNTCIGEVIAVYKDNKLWHVRYDVDGDEEDLDFEEIVDACQRYREVTYGDDDDDNDDDYSPE